MPAPVSVIIPAFNEEALIAAAVDSAFAAGAAEVLVCDGESSDATAAIAAAHGARVVSCERMRARQLNRGVEAAANGILVFLHADTRLPEGAAAAIGQALLEGAAFGGFRIRFAEKSWRLRWTAMMINLRTSITRCPWGDQAQFIHRDVLQKLNGFADIPILEDYELAIRMKRSGRTRVLPLTVTTSGRRFLRKGLLRTTVMNWRIIISYRFGADPQDLAEIYRR